VGQVYDGGNVWANVQPSGRPWEMRWNLSAAKDSVPFFGPALPQREMASIQVRKDRIQGCDSGAWFRNVGRVV
jgi:hypothetical protein